MNIKQELIELCKVQVAFWEKFKNETELIPEDDDASIVLKWDSFFKDNVESVNKLIDVRKHMKQAEEQLIMNQELFYEE